MAKPGRKPTDRYWVEFVRTEGANNPKLSAAAITRKAEKRAARFGRDDPPSARAVGRILKRLRDMSEQDVGQYRYVFWPESFERGDLPWEAQAATLELLKFMNDSPDAVPDAEAEPDLCYGAEPRFAEDAIASLSRPSVYVARWYWRLSQALPYSSPGTKFSFALDFWRRARTEDLAHGWAETQEPMPTMHAVRRWVEARLVQPDRVRPAFAHHFKPLQGGADWLEDYDSRHEEPATLLSQEGAEDVRLWEEVAKKAREGETK